VFSWLTASYQLWLNLPKKTKWSPPQFTMQWAEHVPTIEHNDGGKVVVTLLAGKYGGKVALAPPTASWASDPESDLAIWVLDMAAGAKATLPPPAKAETRRMLYVHCPGARVRVGDQTVEAEYGFEAESGAELPLVAETKSRVLVLQAVPIDEPIVVKGPFVMNTQEEINQAYKDYKATRFGWDDKWNTQAPVYAREEGRFADYGDGVKTRPPAK
jgi:redox-sensitive bicupin YhaK (pirin superfamily)